MSGDIATFIGFIVILIVSAIAIIRKTARDRVQAKIEAEQQAEVQAKIVAEQQAEVKAREEAAQSKARAEAEARAKEQRARLRGLEQARIDALTKEQDQRKAIAEKMTVRLNVPLEQTDPEQILLKSLKTKHALLISDFHEITERKVSLRDEYGDERWDALDKEADVVINKIKQRDGVPENRAPHAYTKLADSLKQSFRDYHRDKRTQSIGQPDFASMTGPEFEAYVMNLLNRLGYAVYGTPATGDQGADVLAKKGGKTIVIQTKNYRGTVGNDAVQEGAAAVRFYDGDEGWVVTNSRFTPAAIELAQRNDVRLIDGNKLAGMIHGAATR